MMISDIDLKYSGSVVCAGILWTIVGLIKLNAAGVSWFNRNFSQKLNVLRLIDRWVRKSWEVSGQERGLEQGTLQPPSPPPPASLSTPQWFSWSFNKDEIEYFAYKLWAMLAINHFSFYSTQQI